ncbi:PNPOx family protein [Luteipulveratus flavus]|uniref:Pyridoxamine 5'-phosphate oxidase family protein n=1 Tax=Luteipulveratus flavus TaxID=3031728 RepID=A0ABT6CFY7_9MICO|nr:pyridoxamine 5'-phosphate oxidase family protein [Luteipulveratus sp. YIM 133296]MDF8266201.1 pyridoxamine 5'-phosphate oxidase family protein [Luteipulveratus sp. YIM 133296]
MRLDADEARARLGAHVHGVLCTLHPQRGPDPVPVVYAVTDDGHVGVPVDRVKPKASSRLQRETNLDQDPRAALLVEGWDAEDWSRLWWVRAQLEHVPDPPAPLVDDLVARLARTVPQDADRPFDHLLVCRVVSLTGWAARDA